MFVVLWLAAVEEVYRDETTQNAEYTRSLSSLSISISISPSYHPLCLILIYLLLSNSPDNPNNPDDNPDVKVMRHISTKSGCFLNGSTS